MAKMINSLFVYGTLAPGRENGHLLGAIPGGSWVPGSVRGTLHPLGWGKTMGYPAIRLEHDGGRVEGLVFSSQAIGQYWGMLDEFEGDAYQRVITRVALQDESVVEAYVYELKQVGFRR